MTDKEICKRCGSICCKFIRLPLDIPLRKVIKNWDKEWMKCRGVVEKKKELEIKNIGVNLDVWNLICKIHSNKPRACREFLCEKLKSQ
jgi:Fe-S-cluster containining protein